MEREPLLASQVFQDEEIQFIPSERRNTGLTRSTSAPAKPIMGDFRNIDQTLAVKSKYESNSIVRRALLLLIIYLLVGVAIYIFDKENFSGIETHPVVDAIYFSIVTLCTVGYGDVAPLSPATKVFTCIFVLMGFGFINISLRGLVNYALDYHENLFVANSRVNLGGRGNSSNGFLRNCIFDIKDGRLRTRVKVGLALGVVILCIGMGATVLHFVEKFDVLDSIYLSVMSVTTVGSYGGKAFNTIQGRLFASLWLLVSTLSVARVFLYLAEIRVDKRHRRMEKWILHRQMTVDDLVAADINNNGFISKAEFAIYKLKEMGLIKQKDILLVCNQFDKIDRNNSGKITISDLLQ
ncbi:two-pore potassium channel 5-like isoform X1 [Papaver somniferum]|uniref:two-pore potassium channel 5-like isoform X1 n=1 Tax=Papaver somniferum TaxID=3469 RepID=UPI000E700A7F|nr:two-pore potassium channel 5-like isoform X1 [Papaver somniferum]